MPQLNIECGGGSRPGPGRRSAGVHEPMRSSARLTPRSPAGHQPMRPAGQVCRRSPRNARARAPRSSPYAGCVRQRRRGSPRLAGLAEPFAFADAEAGETRRGRHGLRLRPRRPSAPRSSAMPARPPWHWRAPRKAESARSLVFRLGGAYRRRGKRVAIRLDLDGRNRPIAALPGRSRYGRNTPFSRRSMTGETRSSGQFPKGEGAALSYCPPSRHARKKFDQGFCPWTPAGKEVKI